MLKEVIPQQISKGSRTREERKPRRAQFQAKPHREWLQPDPIQELTDVSYSTELPWPEARELDFHPNCEPQHGDAGRPI